MSKTRPVVSVSADGLGVLPLQVVVPITEWKPHYSSYPWMVQLLPDSVNRLKKPSAADCFQVRSLSENRFIEQVGAVSADALADIVAAIGIVIGL